MRKATIESLRSIITELTREQIEEIVSMPLQGGMSITQEDIECIIRSEELRKIKAKRKRIIKKLLSE